MACRRNHHPLDLAMPQLDDDGHAPRTGTIWTCVAHIITAVIGSGVLALSWSVAQLGWIAGPITILCFAFVTYVSAFLLSDCYRSPDPVKGQRNCSYMDAVRVNLGNKQTLVCGWLQYLNMYGTGIAYTITTATSARAIEKANCYHREGRDASCGGHGDSFYMLLFGAAQLLLSFIPNLHDMAWLSVIAAVMSFAYSVVGLALGLARTIANGRIKGDIGGVPIRTPADKVWRVSQAIGDIAFAYPYASIVLEIQDTLRSPPPENETMKKASAVAVLATTFFYLSVGCFGYAAFGNAAPGNLLTGFGFYEPYWLIDFANACIVLHLLGGYQVYSQPMFSYADRYFSDKFPDSGFVNKLYTVRLLGLPGYKVSLQRLCFRTAYVASTTCVAVLFGYFNEVLGLLGAFNFWPLTIYYPVEMYCKQKQIQPWTRKWVVLQAFSVVCFVATVFALVGSVQGVMKQRLG